MKVKVLEVPVVVSQSQLLVNSSVVEVKEELEDGELRPEEVPTSQVPQDVQINKIAEP